MLDFSPGPIRAVDGDSGLNSPLSYAILSGNPTYQSPPKCQMCFSFMCTHVCVCCTSEFTFLLGDDDGRFLMDRKTGAIKLMRRVGDRLTTPSLHLQVMVRLTTCSVLVAFLFFHAPNVSLSDLHLTPRHIRTTIPGSTLLLQC